MARLAGCFSRAPVSAARLVGGGEGLQVGEWIGCGCVVAGSRVVGSFVLVLLVPAEPDGVLVVLISCLPRIRWIPRGLLLPTGRTEEARRPTGA